MAADYKELIVWQKAISLVTRVYAVTRNFPADERFGITNQLRRAAVSIASNIAEGQGRQSRIEFARFLRISNGSRQEVETQLVIAHELQFLTATDLTELCERLGEIGRLTAGLLQSIARRSAS